MIELTRETVAALVGGCNGLVQAMTACGRHDAPGLWAIVNALNEAEAALVNDDDDGERGKQTNGR